MFDNEKLFLKMHFNIQVHVQITIVQRQSKLGILQK